MSRSVLFCERDQLVFIGFYLLVIVVRSIHNLSTRGLVIGPQTYMFRLIPMCGRSTTVISEILNFGSIISIDLSLTVYKHEPVGRVLINCSGLKNRNFLSNN